MWSKTSIVNGLLVILLLHVVCGCHSPEPSADEYYQKGLEHKAQKAYAQAAEQFRLALSLAPRQISFLRERGIALCHTKQYRQAVKHFLQAQQYGDDSYPVCAWLAYAYEQLGNWQYAEHFYLESLKRAPGLIDIRLRLADLFERQHQRRKAAEMLLEVLALKPEIESADFLRRRASLLQQPQSQAVHYALADLYIRYGDVKRGTAEYRQARPFQVNNPDTLLEFGMFCLDRRQYSTALTCFQQAQSLESPAQRDVHAGLGVAYEQLERYESAIQEYRAVLQLDPTWHELYLKLAELLKKLHKPREAADELEHLFHLSTDSSDTPLGTGIFPSTNQLWAEILRLRSATFEKAVVQIKPSEDRYPVVDALVNHDIPVTLLVEEHAQYTILSEKLAQSLDIRITSRTSDVQFSVDGQRYSAPLINLPSLKIGGLEVRNIPTIIWNLSRYPGLDGFLGRNFLKHFQVEINSEERLLILTKLYS